MRDRSQIDQVRDRTDLVAIVRETVKLQQRGRSWTGLCPFHQEKSPSFSVNPERGLFYCFGCKASGDVFKFVELTEGLSFRETLEKLAERAGITLVDDRQGAGPGRDKAEEQRARKAKDELYAANAIAAAFFAKMLREHPLASHARDELNKRGLRFDDAEMVPVLESFHVGYAPHGWDSLATHLRQQGISPTQGETVGLLSPRSSGSGYYDSFRHRLMVAIVDAQGRVAAFSGRALPELPGDKVDPDRAPPKYVNSKESSIYSKGSTLFGLWQARSAIRSRGECVVVEGNFDLIAMHARGVQHVVAPMGTAFTADQARLIKRFTQTVTLLFDGDSAGKKALWASRPILREAGLSAKAVRMREGKDPDEFLRSHPVKELWDVLGAAKSLDELLIKDACDRVGLGSNLEAKQALLEKIRPMIEEAPIDFRPGLSQRVAEWLGLDVEGMWRRVRAGSTTSSEAPSRAPASKATKPIESKEERWSRLLVTTLAAAPELFDDDAFAEAYGLVAGDWALALAALKRDRRESIESGRAFGGAEVMEALPESTRDAIAAAVAAQSLDPTQRTKAPAHDDGRDHPIEEGAPEPVGVDVDEARRVVRQTVIQLEREIATARFAEIKHEIEQAEASGDFAEAARLAQEKARARAALREAEAKLRAEGSG
ncbi:MAG: DNA primase [Polyangiales bacterium]